MTAPSAPLRLRLAETLSAFGIAATKELIDALVVAVKPPSSAPAVVEAYRQAFGRYPAKHLWDDMAAAVGERVELWRDVCAAWALRGYNPANLAGMYEWFRAGAVPQNGRTYDRNQKGAGANGRSGAGLAGNSLSDEGLAWAERAAGGGQNQH